MVFSCSMLEELDTFWSLAILLSASSSRYLVDASIWSISVTSVSSRLLSPRRC